jgi:hypothetical protein
MKDYRTSTVDGAAGFEACRKWNKYKRHTEQELLDFDQTDYIEKITCPECETTQDDVWQSRCMFCGESFDRE